MQDQGPDSNIKIMVITCAYCPSIATKIGGLLAARLGPDSVTERQSKTSSVPGLCIQV